MLSFKRRAVTGLVLVSLAAPSAAAAYPAQDIRNPDRRAPVIRTQDLRNADRRAPVAVHVEPIRVADPVPAPKHSGGFDWTDAATGAAGFGVLAILAGLAMALVSRRRHLGASA